MTTPIQLINNGTTASSCADCADDWESHPLLAGYDEEAVARAAEAPTSELPEVVPMASHKETEARAAEAQVPGTSCGFFVGEVFCAWALSEMPCATCESGFFVGEEFCAWAEWAGSWASTRSSQEHAAAQREQEAARQREQEAARQREQEAARQREQEEPRQRDPESARQREQEAARQLLLHTDTELDGDGECGELAHHRAPRYANGRMHHLRAGGTRRQHRLNEGAVLLV